MHPDDHLQTPWLRDELIDRLSRLADPEWLAAATPGGGCSDAIDEILDFFDDTGVLDEPAARIGYGLTGEPVDGSDRSRRSKHGRGSDHLEGSDYLQRCPQVWHHQGATRLSTKKFPTTLNGFAATTLSDGSRKPSLTCSIVLIQSAPFRIVAQALATVSRNGGIHAHLGPHMHP